MQLWDEQEQGTSKETLLLKAFDRLLPFLLNLQNKSGTWIEPGITRQQVLASQSGFTDLAPEIHQWVLAKIELACANGWLKT